MGRNRALPLRRRADAMTRTLTLLPFMLLLFVLPFPGTVALRLVCLAVAFLVAIALWRRLVPPAIPCKPALLAWMAVAFLSLAWAVDPAYSLGEDRKSTRLNSSHSQISYAVFCLKKNKN